MGDIELATAHLQHFRRVINDLVTGHTAKFQVMNSTMGASRSLLHQLRSL